MSHFLKEIGNTIVLPVERGVTAVYHCDLRIKVVSLLALAIIFIIPSTRHAFGHAAISFVNNPIYGGLAGGLMTAIYLAIGRELVNKKKFVFDKGDEDNYPFLKIFEEEYPLTEIESDIDIENDNSLMVSGQKESLVQKLAKNEAALTLTLPITASITSICPNKRNIAIAVIAALAITTLIGVFHKDVFEACNITIKFLSHPMHAGLVSGIVSVAYIAIGRELLVREKYSINENLFNFDGKNYTLRESYTQDTSYGSEYSLSFSPEVTIFDSRNCAIITQYYT